MYMDCLLTILNQQFIEMLSSLRFLNPTPVVGFTLILYQLNPRSLITLRMRSTVDAESLERDTN
jgi:hypothetical protein